jgi:hypothetical protein
MQAPSNDSTVAKTIVEHSYHDFSEVSEADVANRVQESEDASNGHQMEQNFPAKLHYVLSELEREGRSDIAGFMPHGRSFKVFNQREFVEQVLRWYVVGASRRPAMNLLGSSRSASTLLSQLVSSNKVCIVSTPTQHLRLYTCHFWYVTTGWLLG